MDDIRRLETTGWPRSSQMVSKKAKLSSKAWGCLSEAIVSILQSFVCDDDGERRNS